MEYLDNDQMAERNKRIDRLERARSNALRTLMSTDDGKKFLSELLSQCKVLDGAIFTGNSTTFFTLGKREIGLWLLNEVRRVNPKVAAELCVSQLTNEGV